MNDKQNNINSKALVFTGERYVPTLRGDIELEHLHRYLFACKAVAGKTVLDIASGEGYGSAMLAQTAKKVIGVDISQDAVAHAQEKYQAKNLEFRVGSCAAIPLDDASVDVVVSFETIEHLDQHESMMRQIKRVLRPGGVLVISSPDKLQYSDKQNYSNPYHVKELYRDEFNKLLSSYYKKHHVFGQRVVYGSALFCEDGISPVENYQLSADALSAISGVHDAVFLVAVASDAELPSFVSGILAQPINETELVLGWAGTVAERDKQISALNTEIARIKKTVSWRITAPLRALWNIPRHYIAKACMLNK